MSASPRLGLYATWPLAQSEKAPCVGSPMAGSIHSPLTGNAVSPPSSGGTRYMSTVATRSRPSRCAPYLLVGPYRSTCISSWCEGGSCVHTASRCSMALITASWLRCRKVPADVRMSSTTPSLCDPTTVDRFICGAASLMMCAHSASDRKLWYTNARGRHEMVCTHGFLVSFVGVGSPSPYSMGFTSPFHPISRSSPTSLAALANPTQSNANPTNANCIVMILYSCYVFEYCL
mmetsp:Transcript_25114/g.63686  ORF Transcript_25114/g.63686 Transcript_25114/m.63686 type:complete len:233 (+) Transcript_25114:989-1687(+)